MRRYGFGGPWGSFPTAGGGPAGGHARPRVPPPHPTPVRTVPLRIATRMRRATCIVTPSLRKCVVRRCPTRQPLPERVRVVGQAPLLEDRQGHGPHAAFASTGRQALLVKPRLEFVGLGVGGDGSLEQVPLDRQADRVGCRVAPTAAPSALRRVDGGEQLGAHDSWARVHASPLRRSVEDGGGAGGWWRPRRSNLHQPPPTSPNLPQPRRSVIRHSTGDPGRSGRPEPPSSAATPARPVVKSSSR